MAWIKRVSLAAGQVWLYGCALLRRWAWRFLAALTLTLVSFALSTRINWQPKEVQASSGFNLDEEGQDNHSDVPEESEEGEDMDSEVHEEVQDMEEEVMDRSKKIETPLNAPARRLELT